MDDQTLQWAIIIGVVVILAIVILLRDGEDGGGS
jgi:hypothetical protein